MTTSAFRQSVGPCVVADLVWCFFSDYVYAAGLFPSEPSGRCMHIVVIPWVFLIGRWHALHGAVQEWTGPKLKTSGFVATLVICV